MTEAKYKQSITAKRFEGTDVYEAAKARMHHIYDLHETVTVAFSGGKDSTAVLNVAAEVAAERDQLPLKVYFFDEEAIPYETEDYVRRVHQREDIDLTWYCVPLRENNACSTAHPVWWPWAPEDEDRWVRPLPPEAVTEIPGFPTEPAERPAHVDGIDLLMYGPADGQTCVCMGIRAAESIMRYRAVNRRSHDEDNYITPQDSQRFPNHGNIWKGYPIYDWEARDVWTAPGLLGWDYNAAYDVMAMAGVAVTQQRCSPAFGTEPLQKLHTYKTCFPDIWERMLERVPGVATAARYALTEIYGYGSIPPKPDGMKWVEFMRVFLDRQAPEWRRASRDQIGEFIRTHFRVTSDPILPDAPHPQTGVDWRILVQIAMRGDPRKRKQPGARAAASPERFAVMRANYDAQRQRLEEDGLMDEVLL